jgi:predicted sulfurtransferase
VMLYSRWVMDLADEFSDRDTADPSPKAGVYGLVAQQWLAREGANAQLSLTRELLKVVMSRLPSLARATETEFNISELARSLHTDRANLAKMSKTAKPTR